MQVHRKSGLPLIFAVLLCALLLTACGRAQKRTPTPEVTATDSGIGNMEVILPGQREREETPSPSPQSADTGDLGAIRKLMDEGQYYDAFRQMLLYEEKHTDAASIQACEALFDKLEPLLRRGEPVSGQELVRTFIYRGGCELKVVAESGPVLLTVTQTEAEGPAGTPPAYSRFYVRKGESGTITLPAGIYSVSYQVGYLWFGEDLGFGDYWTGGELDSNLVFETSTTENLVKNSRFTLTF